MPAFIQRSTAMVKASIPTEVVGPWLQVGPDTVNVGAGPALGIYRNSSGTSDLCAGIQAEAKIFSVRKTANLLGPFNITGAFDRCPLR